MLPSVLASPSTYRVQKTVKHPISLEGIGLHTGARSQVRIHPAPPNHGLIFYQRVGQATARIPAHYDYVVATDLATSLGLSSPPCRISTVEHLLSALFAMGITNAVLEVSGPEIPILDGSAYPFLSAIWEAGLELQPFTSSILRILKPVKIYEKGAVCELLPRSQLRLTTSIDFPHPKIGLQTFALDVTPQGFRKQVGAARTFGFLRDVDRLKRHRLALGASLENVLAFSDDGVLNPEGMRHSDECVRHKLLDALGDLALCGSWIEGEFVSFRGGHSIHLALLKLLKSKRGHWELEAPQPLTSLSSSSKLTHSPLPLHLPASE